METKLNPPGFEPRTSDMRGERVPTTPPTHIGRIRIFTSDQTNVFTLERCDWCARRIEQRHSNCPGCDDQFTHQSRLPIRNDVFLGYCLIGERIGYRATLECRILFKVITSPYAVKSGPSNRINKISLFAVLMSVNAEECTLMKPIVAVVLSALYDSAFSVKGYEWNTSSHRPRLKSAIILRRRGELYTKLDYLHTLRAIEGCSTDNSDSSNIPFVIIIIKDSNITVATDVLLPYDHKKPFCQKYDCFLNPERDISADLFHRCEFHVSMNKNQPQQRLLPTSKYQVNDTRRSSGQSDICIHITYRLTTGHTRRSHSSYFAYHLQVVKSAATENSPVATPGEAVTLLDREHVRPFRRSGVPVVTSSPRTSNGVFEAPHGQGYALLMSCENDETRVQCFRLDSLEKLPRDGRSTVQTRLVLLCIFVVTVRSHECEMMEDLISLILSAIYDSALGEELAVEPEDVFSKDFKGFFEKCSNCTQIAANQLQKLDWIFEQCKETYADFTKLLTSLKS
ncbi:hypothetical protein CLF_106447 [Clonorchis sinensis]|uniref:Uncharacterized protein n=1 Tax=Clonorchis sinensis TaxID=79923 RepID=G7YF66_CLOSI|nr:hypothetical protein CLF_106447 [Clonorchis sinensis]